MSADATRTNTSRIGASRGEKLVTQNPYVVFETTEF